MPVLARRRHEIGEPVQELRRIMLTLSLGLCYNVAMADGTVVGFRFNGTNGSGTVIAESPIGSGKEIDLIQLLNRGYKIVWSVPCP